MKSDVLKRNRGLVLCVCVCVLRWCWGDSLILCVSSLSSGARVISLQLECAASFHPDVIFDKLRTHKTNDIYFRANRLIKSATADWLKSCFEFDFDFFFFFALKELQKTLLDFTFTYTHIYVYSARACSNTSLKPYSTHWNIHAHDVSWLRCYITYSGLFICMSLRLSMTYGIFWDVFTRRKCRHKLWCMFLRFYCSCAAWDAQVKRPVGCRNLLCGIGEKTRKRSSYLENERRARISCR